MKKIITPSRHLNFFRFFLLFYLAVLIIHGFEMSWQAPVLVAAFAIGLLIALFGHLRHGHLAIGFLVLHMVLDAIHIGHSGLPSEPLDLGFELFHIGLDIVFLVTELRIHARRWVISLLVIATTLAAIWTISAGGGASVLVASAGEGIFEFFEYLVVGGIMGCVVSHLYRGREQDECECHNHSH